MTVLSPAQITGFTIAPLAPSSSAPSSGSNIGNAVGTDWKRAADGREVKNRKQRRAAIAKARETVESRPAETKAQRLERLASNRETYTGSEKQREVTRGIVAKAAASLQNEAPDNMFADEDFRRVRSQLRAKYPGADLGQLMEVAQQFEKLLLDDPVAGFNAMIQGYSRTKNASPYKEPVWPKGIRGAVARAKVDQEDEQQLRDWIARFGPRLPQILADLNAMDDDLRRSMAFEAAKISARFGAPATTEEIPAYEAKMAAKQLTASRQQGVMLAIQHGLIPGDEEHLNLLADVLSHKDFPWAAHYAQHGQHAELHALVHASHVASQLPKKGAKAAPKSSAASKSISGGSPAPGQGESYVDRARGTRSTRAAIQEATSPGSSSRTQYRGREGTGSVSDSVRRAREGV